MSEMRYFGPKWDAPVTDDAKVMATPTEMACMNCRIHFVEGDAGVLYPTGYAAHKECGLRAAMGGIGHLVDHAFYCHGELGPDAGFTYRESAILVWDWFVYGARLSRPQLEWLRQWMDDCPLPSRSPVEGE